MATTLNNKKTTMELRDFDIVKLSLASPGENSRMVLWRGDQAGNDQLPHPALGKERPF